MCRKFLSFHKYDASEDYVYSDEQMFIRAETRKIESDSFFYGIKDAQQKYFDERGKTIPVINSESNFNSAWKEGSDPKIVQMSGAVWTALLLRSSIINGLDYNIYNRYILVPSRRQDPSSLLFFYLVNLDHRLYYQVQKNVLCFWSLYLE